MEEAEEESMPLRMGMHIELVLVCHSLDTAQVIYHGRNIEAIFFNSHPHLHDYELYLEAA